jgi:hypothetical protein
MKRNKHILILFPESDQDKSERQLKQYETIVADLYQALDKVGTKSKKHQMLVNRIKNVIEIEENEDSIMDDFVS